jgi:hypothetical protein
VTLLEVLFGVALLASAMLAVLTLLQRGFWGAAHLGNHARAESLSRSVLDFYGRLPLDKIEKARKQTGRDRGFAPVDEGVRELLGAEDSYRLHIGLHRLPGRIPVRALVSRVQWDDLGHTREVVHRQILSYGGGVAAGPGAMGLPEEAAGFAIRKKVPDWGRRQRWTVEGYGEEADVDAYPGTAENLAQKVARAAKAAIWEPDAYYAGESGETVYFLGDAEAETRRIRALGEGAVKVPWTLRIAQGNKQRRSRQFEVRTGVSSSDLEGLPMEDIPDGIYPYTLEALDLRDLAGYGRVVGVFTLDAGAEEYRLVASVAPRDDDARTLGVDAVLARKLVQDSRGAVHVLERTESRLVLISIDAEMTGRTLELRTLPAPDGDVPGTAITQRFVQKFMAKRGLEPTRQLRGDELLEALVQEFFGDDTQESTEPPVIVSFPQESTNPCPQGGCRPRAPQRKASLDFEQKTILRWRRKGTPMPGAGTPAQKALAKLAKGDGEAALAELDRYLSENPTDTVARALRGRLRASEGDPSGGADDLAEALRASPGDVDLLRDHAGFLLRAWRLEEAPAALAAFAAAAPEDPLVDTFQQSYELAKSTPENARPPIR